MTEQMPTADALENPKPVLPDLGAAPEHAEPAPESDAAESLKAVYDVPIRVQAVLGRSRMDISTLMRLRSGDVVELDRRVGEPVDILVNNRMIARGEVVLIDGRLGVTLTEVVKQER
ncbi:flagellar motor switch protein FliN [Iodidimonas sp. SYSU 1G8]|uniref:flagellar motor switch protein FliN n=1 Tax=Iodidimonas sp. SYSU 1G8 TaxID=3133967 RepID=UPI0031FE64AE